MSKKELKAQLVRAKELWREEVVSSAVGLEQIEKLEGDLALARYEAAQYHVLLNAVLASGEDPDALIQEAECVNVWQQSVVDEC